MERAELLAMMKRRTAEFSEEMRVAFGAMTQEQMAALLALGRAVGADEAGDSVVVMLAASPELRAVARAMGRAFLALGAEPEN